MAKSPAQLDAEIAQALRRRGGISAPSGVTRGSGTLFAVEIDPAEIDMGRDLPSGAQWRHDIGHLAENELAHGRTYRRPKDARYLVIEWNGARGAMGRLLDWLEATPGITRYAEIF